MTQPDEYVPSGALSSTGLAAYANKDQADWELEQKNLVSGRFTGAQTGFGILVSKVPIIGDAVEIFTGVEDGDRTDLGTAVNSFKTMLGTAWNGLLGAFRGTWNSHWNGSYGTSATNKTYLDVQTAQASVASTANTASTTASTASTNASTSLTKHTNLLTSLRGGYSIDVVSTTSTWTKPTGLSEIFVVCFGGGAVGQSTAYSGGPPGGDPGPVIAVQLDPKDVPATVSCTIGGNTSSTPTKTSFGTLVTTDDAYGGYVATPLGVILTGASPSKGGTGGISSGNGATGATTTVGLAGGTGGTQSPSSNGGNGGAGKTGLVFAGNLCQTGGSGGGGGGGSNYSLGKGGNGGQGGFPGGGGGGGGIGSKGNGTGGNGGLGLILVIYKLATNT